MVRFSRRSVLCSLFWEDSGFVCVCVCVSVRASRHCRSHRLAGGELLLAGLVPSRQLLHLPPHRLHPPAVLLPEPLQVFLPSSGDKVRLRLRFLQTTTTTMTMMAGVVTAGRTRPRLVRQGDRHWLIDRGGLVTSKRRPLQIVCVCCRLNSAACLAKWE